MIGLQTAHWVQEVQSLTASQLKLLVWQMASMLLTSFSFASVKLAHLRSLRHQLIAPLWPSDVRIGIASAILPLSRRTRVEVESKILFVLCS